MSERHIVGETPIEIEDVRTKDAAALARYRAGDKTVIREFYFEYGRRWLIIAKRLAGPSAQDAEDLLSEALTRTIEALEKGGGPQGNVSAYVVRAMRNIRNDAGREALGKPTTVTDDIESTLEASGLAVAASHDEIDLMPEVEALREVFLGLPERWRRILWATEIEGRAPMQLADDFGLSANAVAQLAKRARTGLKTAYVTAELTPAPSDCDRYTPELIAHALGESPLGDGHFVLDHVRHCDSCRARMAEADRLSRAMRTITAPALLGVAEMTRGSAAAVGAGLSAAAKWVIAGVTAAALVAGGAVLYYQLRDPSPTYAAPAVTDRESSSPAPTVPGPTARPGSPEPSPFASPGTASATETPASLAPTGRDAGPAPAATTPEAIVEPKPEISSLAVAYTTDRLATDGVTAVDTGPIAAGQSLQAVISLPAGVELVGATGWTCSQDGAAVVCDAPGPSDGLFTLTLSSVGPNPAHGVMAVDATVTIDDSHEARGLIEGEVEIASR